MEILLQFLDFEVNYLVNMVDAGHVVNNVKEGKEDRRFSNICKALTPFFNRKTIHKIEPDVTQSMRLVRKRESPVFNSKMAEK